VSEYTIGIKIASGEYYPVLESGQAGKKKKLILTTVKDNQTSVQIDVYKGDGKEIADAAYIGSLVIENITETAKGEPEIELILGIDADENLTATAGDLATGERQTLSVSLESLSEEGIYDVPEFELDENFADEEFDEETFPEEETAEPADEDFLTEDFGAEGPALEEETPPEFTERKKMHPLLLVLFVIFGLVIIAVISFFIFKTFQGPETPPLEARNSTSQAVASIQADEPEEIPAAVEADKTPEEMDTGEMKTAGNASSDQQETAQPPPDEVWYKIKRGDTLWDISTAYYRNPWLYGKIAKENNIKNPDLIYADTTIRIPPQ